VWNLLAWPFDEAGKFLARDVVTGAVVALVVALIMREITTQQYRRWISPSRIFWFFAYLCVVLYYIIRANFDVAYRVLHPAMPIRPGVVKVRTKLRTATAITMLANSITLTPGTHVVDATEDGVLYVHWINVKTTDGDEASRMIVGRFEWLLEKIFE
jgi:multicomponent Na+:H+ antiporter subunit E